MSELILENICKSFGASRVLDGISLRAPAGAYVCLLGPSGSGKSTLLRGVAGLIALDAGAITLGGRTLTSLPPEARELGMVFQSYAVWPHKTVFDNVAYPLQLRRQSGIDAAVAEVLDVVGLGGFGPRLPATLSGGQQQRVALARALVMRPRALLLDEPLANLDPHLRAELCDRFRQISRERGLLFVHVTHDREEALGLATDLVVLDHGRLIEHGPPERLFHAPRTRFVAEFVALGVTLPARLHVRRDDGTADLVLDDGTVIDARWQRDERATDPLCLVLPGHALRIDPEGPLSATVIASAYAGTHTIAHVELTAGASARVTTHTPVTPGERLRLSADVRWAF